MGFDSDEILLVIYHWKILKMKLIVNCIFSILMIGFVACEQKENPDKTVVDIASVAVYDSIKAKKYGADPYGMRKYVMAFLKIGSNRSQDSVEAARLQAAHMANIGKMVEAGKLTLAGPFFGDGDLRGIYIFNVASIEEAEALTNSDPAIQAGSLVMELKEWYGSAGLMMVNEIHPQLAKESF